MYLCQDTPVQTSWFSLSLMWVPRTFTCRAASTTHKLYSKILAHLLAESESLSNLLSTSWKQKASLAVLRPGAESWRPEDQECWGRKA